MNPLKKAVSSTVQFVAEHKMPIVIITTAAATAVVAKKMYGSAYVVAQQFIADKGLSEEFLEFIPTKK